MRLSVLLLALLLTLSAVAFCQDANSSANPPSAQKATISPNEKTLTGCLAGHHDGYRLTEKDGTVHQLMPVPENKGLRSHVGHIVTLGGYPDNNRDTSASSDEGTARGLRFFQVNELVSDSGNCK